MAELPAKSLFAAQNCRSDARAPFIQWVTNAEEWRQWQSSTPRQIIPLDDAGTESAKPQVNFSESVVVVVGLGQKSTGGYAISLRKPEVEVSEGQLTVPVQQDSPAPDAFVTQALTSPCVAIAIPKVDVHQLRAVDQNGDLLVEASVR